MDLLREQTIPITYSFGLKFFPSVIFSDAASNEYLEISVKSASKAPPKHFHEPHALLDTATSTLARIAGRFRMRIYALQAMVPD